MRLGYCSRHLKVRKYAWLIVGGTRGSTVSIARHCGRAPLGRAADVGGRLQPVAASDRAVTVRRLHSSAVRRSTTTTHKTVTLSPEAARKYVANLGEQELTNLQNALTIYREDMQCPEELGEFEHQIVIIINTQLGPKLWCPYFRGVPIERFLCSSGNEHF